jgi:hypothetical protein
MSNFVRGRNLAERRIGPLLPVEGRELVALVSKSIHPDAELPVLRARLIEAGDFDQGVRHPSDSDELDVDGAGDVGGVPRIENKLAKLFVGQAVVLIVVGRQKENLIVPPDLDHLLEADLERIPFVQYPACAREWRPVIVDDWTFPNPGQTVGDMSRGLLPVLRLSDPWRGRIERVERHFQAYGQFRGPASPCGLEDGVIVCLRDRSSKGHSLPPIPDDGSAEFTRRCAAPSRGTLPRIRKLTVYDSENAALKIAPASQPTEHLDQPSGQARAGQSSLSPLATHNRQHSASLTLASAGR